MTPQSKQNSSPSASAQEIAERSVSSWLGVTPERVKEHLQNPEMYPGICELVALFLSAITAAVARSNGAPCPQCGKPIRWAEPVSKGEGSTLQYWECLSCGWQEKIDVHFSSAASCLPGAEPATTLSNASRCSSVNT